MTPNQLKWLAALESGEYEQGTEGFLCMNGKYCCLGVAAEIFKTEQTKVKRSPITEAMLYGEEENVAPQYVIDALHLRSNTGIIMGKEYCLTELNDTGTTFKEIAAFIRKHPRRVFKETSE